MRNGFVVAEKPTVGKPPTVATGHSAPPLFKGTSFLTVASRIGVGRAFGVRSRQLPLWKWGHRHFRTGAEVKGGSCAAALHRSCRGGVSHPGSVPRRIALGSPCSGGL
jgi:hypothetical protein